MRDFKGTKGNEDERFSYAFNILYPNWHCEDVIEMSTQKEVKGFQKGYERALKDSCAHEMLDLLKEIFMQINYGSDKWKISEIGEMCEKLYNKATEV